MFARSAPITAAMSKQIVLNKMLAPTGIAVKISTPHSYLRTRPATTRCMSELFGR